MAKLDLELTESLIISYIASDLAAKVLEINTEKNDGISINDIQAYFNTFADVVNNYQELIFYGMDNSSEDSIGPATADRFEMFVLSLDCMAVNSIVAERRKKAFRYSRAFKEILQTRFKDDGRFKLTITGLVPQLFRINEKSPLYYVGGVLVSGVIA